MLTIHDKIWIVSTTLTFVGLFAWWVYLNWRNH
jgi:hypothetical protein